MFYAQKRGITHRIKGIGKQSLSFIADRLPFSWLKQAANTPFFLPFYHLVRDDAPSYITPLYACRSSKLFEDDLDFFLKHFHPVSLSELIQEIQQPGSLSTKKPLMHLSFDDGLSESVEVIAPILQKKGVPASFFLNPAFLDNKALMFRYKVALCIERFHHLIHTKQGEAVLNKLLGSKSNLNASKNITEVFHQLDYSDLLLIEDLAIILDLDFSSFLRKEQPYLSSIQVKQLLHQGFSIGSHSYDHPYYPKLSLAQQLEQTLKGQRELEVNFELPHRVFAFPFTDYNVSSTFIKQLFEEHHFDLCFGGAGLKLEQEKRHLQRIAMESQQLFSAQFMVKTAYFSFFIKRFFAKHRIHRKAASSY